MRGRKLLPAQKTCPAAAASVPTLSRTHPQDGAASHYSKRKDESARREDSVNASQAAKQPSPSVHRSEPKLTYKTAIPSNPAARAMRARPDNPNTGKQARAATPKKNPITQSRNGSRVEDPCRVQGQRPCPPEAPCSRPRIPAPSSAYTILAVPAMKEVHHAFDPLRCGANQPRRALL